jgi:hypothetical protein
MLNDKSDFYTSLEEAKDEIWNRWHNTALRKKVADIIGKMPRHFARDTPRCIGSKHSDT